MLDECYVIYRPIGCEDESSTDAEQGEKLLFAYPSQSLDAQLTRVMMLEGLIDFSSKFSNEDIETTIMDKKTWSFLQAEPGLWMVCSTCCTTSSGMNQGREDSSINQYSITGGKNMKTKNIEEDSFRNNNRNGGKSFQPSGTGLCDALSKMYRLYITLHGEITKFINSGYTGSGNKSLDIINNVKLLRKRQRKTRLQLLVDEHDMELLLEIESENYKEKENGDGDGDGDEDSDVTGANANANASRNASTPGYNRNKDDIQLNINKYKKQIEELEVQIQEAINPKTITIESENGNDNRNKNDLAYTPSIVRKQMSIFFSWYIKTGEMHNPSLLHTLSGMHFCTIGNPAFQGLIRVRQALNDISKNRIIGCLLLYDGQIAWSDLDDEATLCIYELLRLHEHDKLRKDVKQYTNLLSDNTTRNSNSNSNSNSSKHNRSRGYSNGNSSEVRSGSSNKKSSNSSSCSSSSSKNNRPRSRTASNASITNIEAGYDVDGDIDPDTWLYNVRNSRGFITAGWDTANLEDDIFYVDENDGSNFNDNKEKNKDDYETFNVGKSKIWCPRFHSISIDESLEAAAKAKAKAKAKATNSNSKSKSKSKLNIDFDELQLLTSNRNVKLSKGKCQIIGRFLIYRQASILLALVLPDWDENKDIDNKNDKNSRQTQTQIDFLNLCASLQRGVTSELDSLLNLLDLSRNTSTSSSSSSSSSNSSSNANNAGSRSSINKRNSLVDRSKTETIRTLYFNACNRAVKHSGLYRNSLDPAYLWPQPLTSSGSNNGEMTDILAQQPLISRICAEYRARFPVPAALLSELLEPTILRAFNEARDSMNTSVSTKGEGTKNNAATEVCIRLSTAQRGGKWMIARCLGDRHVYLIVEGCATLNEMQDVVKQNTETVFSRVVL
jgi:hypothetical protein